MMAADVFRKRPGGTSGKRSGDGPEPVWPGPAAGITGPERDLSEFAMIKCTENSCI